jgi:hypothetical protein
MKYIAHRGLIDGPDIQNENRLDTIMNTLHEGYDAEIDVWLHNGQWYLGHDEPKHYIDKQFLTMPGLWIHCKNLEALLEIKYVGFNLEYFWHQEDDYTLTSNGFIWTYPGKPLTINSICVQPERQFLELDEFQAECYGVCSKYVRLLKQNAK